MEFRNRHGRRMVGDLLLASEGRERPAVLLIHGLGGHRNEPHMLGVARAIAERGIHVLRFDLTNNAGESEGSFADLTLSGEVDDGEDALDWLLARPEVDSTRLGVAGHSFGGLVSVLLAARRPDDVRAIVPMSAVFDAPARFRRNFAAREPEWRARQVIALGPGGPMLKVSFLDDLAGWDVREHARRVRAPALIVHGTADESVPTSDAAELASVLRTELVSVHLIEGADHVYSDAGALREVQGLVAEWFSDRL